MPYRVPCRGSPPSPCVLRRLTWTGTWAPPPARRPGTPCGPGTSPLQGGGSRQRGQVRRGSPCPPMAVAQAPLTPPEAPWPISAPTCKAAAPPSPAQGPSLVPGCASRGQGTRPLTAGPVRVVPPVDADALPGTEGRVGLQAGALHARVGHEAAVEHAGVIVVLGGYQGVARSEHAVRERHRSPSGGEPPARSPTTRSWAARAECPGRPPGRRRRCHGGPRDGGSTSAPIPSSHAAEGHPASA